MLVAIDTVTDPTREWSIFPFEREKSIRITLTQCLFYQRITLLCKKMDAHAERQPVLLEVCSHKESGRHSIRWEEIAVRMSDSLCGEFHVDCPGTIRKLAVQDGYSMLWLCKTHMHVKI
jgi:hypothetical protein